MYPIIDDSSTVAYEDFCQSRKRARSTKSDSGSDESGPTFNYTTAEPIPYIQNPCINAYPMATFQPPGYQQYYCYPDGVAVAGAAHGAAEPAAAAASPAPAAPAPAKAPEPKADGNAKKTWLGRSKAQVDEDNLKIAVREDVYKYDAMKPVGAAPDKMFWVVELDGRTTLRMFKTIDEDLGPGKWERDARFGNAYFVRDEPEEK
ncbi:hypothetical protein ANO11243_019600 [Dothideomycetidae sp. 11243]|nr:hypothetical protein ANO11243_019600 [fungal sp. No.11243]